MAVRFLDKEQLGLWNVVAQVVGYLVWLDLGVSTMTGRILAEPIQHGNQEDIDRTWSSILVILGIQAVGIVTLGIAGTSSFIGFFDVPPNLRSDAIFLFMGMVLNTAIGLPLRAAPGIFLCQDRLYLSMLIQGVMPWVNLLAFWLMLVAGHGIRSFVISSAVVTVSQFLCQRWLLQSDGHRLTFRPQLVSVNSVRPILGFSSAMMLWSVAPAAIASIPAVVIGRQIGLENVSIYNVTSRVPAMMASIGMRTFHSFYPRIQRHFVSGDQVRFTSLFRLATWLAVWITGILLTVSVAMNSTVVNVLARADFYGGNLLSILMATGLLMVSIGDQLGSLFYCAGKARMVSPVLALEVVATFAAAAFLCHRHGLPGVAVAVAFMPALIRIPYFAWCGPAACNSAFRTLYGPATTGIAALLLSAWGACYAFGVLTTRLGVVIGVSMIFMGSICTVISMRQGWHDWIRYHEG